MNPTISIITVVYNDVRNRERTIQSVLSQTFTNIEYIIIDGESTDGTIDVIKKYESKIDYICSEKDNGIYDAMNKGIRHASGKWLNFMNSGDIFVNENVLSNIFSNKFKDEIKFLYSNYFEIVNQKKILNISSFERGIILHQSCIYQRQLHEIYGFYLVKNKNIISDYLFFCSLPLEIVQKVDFPISCNQLGGISRGIWCGTQWLCAQVIFNGWSVNKMVYEYYKRVFNLYMPKRLTSIIRTLKFYFTLKKK
jgi:glycosyltransferase involved in cell wall biosynthesis